MIRNREDLRFYLKYIAYLIYGFENAYILKYLRLLRYCEYHYNCHHKIRLKLNIDIPLNVCGYGLRIRHLSGGGGILLNARKIGNYCSFNSGVLLGNKDDNSKKPILGERVSFGPSAKAFGDIVIEDDVFVAPGAIVTKSVSKSQIVGGIPAKLLKNK